MSTSSTISRLNAATFLFVFLCLAVACSATVNPLATSFVRTDMPPAAAVFDPAHKVIYVSVPDLGKVVVVSAPRHTILASIPVPWARGMDLSPDGAYLIVGSGSFELGGPATNFLTIINTNTLEVVSRTAIPPQSAFNADIIPGEVAWMNNGSVIIVAWQWGVTGSKLLQWFPAQSRFVDRSLFALSATSPTIAKSGDGSKLIIDGSVMYDASSDTLITSGDLHGMLAANNNGTEFAVQAGNRLFLLDNALNLQAALFLNNISSDAAPLFSADGTTIYAPETTGTSCDFALFDTSTFMPKGYIPSACSSIAGIDDQNEIFGIRDRGVEFNNFAVTGARPLAPALGFPIVLNPPVGPVGAPGASSINIPEAPSAVFFGSQPGLLTGSSVVPPASFTAGPVDITIVDSSGAPAVAPQAYSYGPSILYVQSDAGPVAGGTPIQLLGYGLASADQSQIQVAIGGRTATVNQVFSGPLISPFLLPIQRVYATVPPGQSGAADITVTTPAGSTTLSNGFHYVAFSSAAGAPNASQMVYDASRQMLYAVSPSSNELDFISGATGALVRSLPQPAGPVGVALTPDASKLLITNAGVPSVTILDLSSGAQQTAPLPNPGQAVAAANNSTALVATINLSLLDNGSLYKLDLNSLALSQEFPFPGLTSDIELHSFNDGANIWVGSGDRADSSGNFTGVWDAATDTFVKTRTNDFIQSDITNDGQVLDASGFFYDSQSNFFSAIDNLDLVELFFVVTGEKLHPGGGLLFTPTTDGNKTWLIDIHDVHTGKLLEQLAIPGQFSGVYDSLALDNTGAKLFAATDAGIVTISYAPPVSIGSVVPNQGSINGSEQLTIHGSGFQPGVTTTIGGAAAETTFIDQNTIQAIAPAGAAGQAEVAVKNPDATGYKLPAAYVYISAVPQISGANPSYVWPGGGAGGAPVLVTVFGSNFDADAVLNWNGIPQKTTVIDATALSADITGATIGPNAGSATLTVKNSDGALSNGFVMPIQLPSPQWSVLLTVLDFGPQLVNSISASRGVTINVLSGSVTNVQVAESGSDFQMISPCSGTLTANCTITATFTPSSTGVRTGTITITSDLGSITVQLIGRGIASGAALIAPYSVDFGTISVFQAATQQFFVTSVGSSDASISSVSASGDFQVIPGSGIVCGGSLAPQQSCSLSVSFAPTAAGARSGSVTIASNAADSPLVIPLTGKAVQPLIFSPSSLDFGSQLSGTTTIKQISVQAMPGVIASLSGLGGGGPGFFDTTNCPPNIYPSTPCSITVSYTPFGSGFQSGALSFWQLAGLGQWQVSIPVTGTATDFSLLAQGPASSIIAAGQSATFNVNATDAGFVGSATLTCSGAPANASCTVTPSTITLTGSNTQTASVVVKTSGPTATFIMQERVIRAALTSGEWFALAGVLLFLGNKKRKRDPAALKLALVLMLTIMLATCSCGGGGAGSTGAPGPGAGAGIGPTSTPAGTYTITVAAEAGGATRQATFLLRVQ